MPSFNASAIGVTTASFRPFSIFYRQCGGVPDSKELQLVRLGLGVLVLRLAEKCLKSISTSLSHSAPCVRLPTSTSSVAAACFLGSFWGGWGGGGETLISRV